MTMDNGFNEPLIEDPNTTVASYPWDGDHGATVPIIPVQWLL